MGGQTVPLSTWGLSHPDIGNQWPRTMAEADGAARWNQGEVLGASGGHPPFPAEPPPPRTEHFEIALQSPLARTLCRSLAPSLHHTPTGLGFGVL